MLYRCVYWKLIFYFYISPKSIYDKSSYSMHLCSIDVSCVWLCIEVDDSILTFRLIGVYDFSFPFSVLNFECIHNHFSYLMIVHFSFLLYNAAISNLFLSSLFFILCKLFNGLCRLLNSLSLTILGVGMWRNFILIILSVGYWFKWEQG